MTSFIHTVKDKSSKLYTKLLHNIVKIPNKNEISAISLASHSFTILFSFIWNVPIIYYLKNLDDESCKCIRDWRHNYIQNIAYLNIIISFLPIIMTYIYINDVVILLFGLIIIILNTINIYAFFTYIGDLNDMNCVCAVVNQPKINYVFNDRRYIMITLYILGIITLLAEINLSISININDRNFTLHI